MASETLAESRERVFAEEQAWHAARLHFAVHGNWLDRDECHTCQGITYPESPYLRLTPWARDHLGVSDYEKLAIRAQALGARVGAFYGARRHQWKCSASTADVHVSLRGAGPLAAVLAGVLDDLEEALA